MATADNNEEVVTDQTTTAALTTPVDATTSKPVVPKPITKRDMLAKLVATTNLTKRQVEQVLDTVHATIVDELKTFGVFTLPGLLKLRVTNKAATTERKSINPATRQPMVVPAKPARKSLKSVPLKVLKDEVL